MFTSYPQNHESLYSQLIYRYEQPSEGDITIFITNSSNDEILGIKKFYSTPTAELNIAPIVRSAAYPNPTLAANGFADPSNCCSVDVTLTDNVEAVSMSRTFTLSHEKESEVGLVTTMSASDRLISMGEGEWLMLRVDPDESVEVEVSQYAYGISRPAATKIYELEPQSSGVAMFGVVADYLPEQMEMLLEPHLDHFEVVVSQGEAVIAELNYSVIDDYEEPVRVAWISSRGSLEHYTFPVVNERIKGVGRKQTLTLSSAYENFISRLAISQVIDSPLVWIVEGGEYHEAKVLSREIDIEPRRELAVVNLKISCGDE